MKIRRELQFMSVLIVMLAVCLAAGPAFGAYNVKQVWQRFSATTGEAITMGQVVCIKAADGLAYKAKSDSATLRPALGIAGNAAALGSKVEIVAAGIFNGWTALSPGAAAYLSATAGAVTQSAPAYSQQVGFAISATEYVFNFRNYQDTSALTALGVLTGASPLNFEGATVDAYDTTLSIEDPTANRTIILPNYSGGLPLVIAQGTTQTSQAGSGTADVTGSSLSISAGWLTATKSLKWTLGGTKTGANAAMKVLLYLSDAAVMTLTAPGVTAVDWVAEFTLTEYTDTAHQAIIGCLFSSAAYPVCDYAAATKDVAGAVTAKAQIQSQNAGDTVTNEYVRVDHWVK